MELRNLRTFRTVARLLSFNRAAERLHYAQSSISAQIQALEEELDVRLFWHVHLVGGVSTTWFFISFPQTGERQRDFEFVADSAMDGYYGGYLLMAIHY